MKKQEQVLQYKEMSQATWELSMIKKESAKYLERANSRQGSLRTEQEKFKCILGSIDTAATDLGFPANTGDKFDLDAFLKFLITLNKSSKDQI